MGRDKALLRLGSRTLLEIVAERTRSVAGELFIVASNGARYAELGFRVVPDLVPDSGSLGGIYSALRATVYEQCLVVGCDMPFLNDRLLTFMVNQPRDYDALVPILAGERSDQGHGVTYETLHAIYSRSALPVIERRLAARQFKIADLLPELRVRELDESTVRRFDPELRSFFNANSPDDFALVERAFLLDTSR
jgi:molybdenum cofactor guanylyltransferase